MEFGDPEVLQIVEVPDLPVASDKIRVRVRVAAIHAADIRFRSGSLAPMLREFAPPWVPGMDLAGDVSAIGDDVHTDVEVGDRIMGLVLPFGTAKGAYAEQLLVDPNWLVRSPKDVSDAEAATLPTNGLTALLALDLLALDPGSTIAISGAGGGLGAFLVQLASHRGLRVVTVAASADDERLRSLGAGVLLDRGPRTPKRIREAVPEGVQAVVDTALIGPELADAVADGGTLVAVRGPQEPGGYDRSANPGVQVRSISVGDYLGRHDKRDELRDLAEQGALTPTVAATYPAEQAADAHRRFEAGGTRGRLVLTF
jgi:NADPH:quinone reductase-like Zn-dependent oxidoreductase